MTLSISDERFSKSEPLEVKILWAKLLMGKKSLALDCKYSIEVTKFYQKNSLQLKLGKKVKSLSSFKPFSLIK